VASIANDPNGRRRIQFVAPDESRKTIRLGKCDRKSAEAIARHVEALLAAKIGGQPIPRDTAVWLAGIGSSLRDKLAAVGLVEAEPFWTDLYHYAWFLSFGTSFLVYAGLTRRRPGGDAWPRGY